VVAVGLLLPYSPIASWFGFSPLPAAFLGILAVMVVIYLFLVEAGKSFFFRQVSKQPHRPIELWAPPPAIRSLERVASHWTIHRRPRRPASPIAR